MFRAILIKYFWVQGQGRGDQRRGAEDAQRAHQGEWGGNKAIRKNRFVQSKQSDAWNNISKFLSKLKVLNYLWYGWYFFRNLYSNVTKLFSIFVFWRNLYQQDFKSIDKIGMTDHWYRRDALKTPKKTLLKFSQKLYK